MSKDFSKDEQDYQKAGFNGTVGFGNTPAIIVIDLVSAYLREGSPLFGDYQSVVAHSNEIIDAARSHGVLVVFTKVEYQNDGLDGGLFWKKVPSLSAFLRGSQYCEFTQEIKPLPGDLILTKQYASAFYGTSLSATLNASNIDTTIFCGVSTSGCVRASATDAISMGFHSIVARDGVGDRSPQIQEANLFDLNAKYADVVTTPEILKYLSSLQR
ncbi:isochorismatase family protein [Acidithrix ferrooxidans]|uniref:Maleamate amidohydrolase n=1 Tax=Acidithrix ferrooxidans TaxID=1280514 RepID=A0A0D8HJY3_9ACTN|nr:isochorismatase family protein [Acidithrix ferrooxidans]KJF18270.1 maleamate amidohydrolase [Acidithrix ferrooxidans]